MEIVNMMVPSVLQSEEYHSIPLNVRDKLLKFIDELSNESSVNKALLHSQQYTHEQRVSDLENNLALKQKECSNYRSELHDALLKVDHMTKMVKECEEETRKSQNRVELLEKHIRSTEAQRDTAIEEKEEFKRTMERKLAEIEICQTDISSLNSKLASITNEKCEIMLKAGDLDCKRIDLEVREKAVEQKCDVLRKQIQSLSEQLAKQTQELTIVRTEHITKMGVLQSQLSQKIEEVRISQATNDEIMRTNKKLLEQLECVKVSLQEELNRNETLHEKYMQEIIEQKKIVADYKGMNDQSVAKTVELENAVCELNDMMEKAMIKHEDLINVMKEKQIFYEKQLAEKDSEISKMELELQTANEVVKTSIQECVEATMQETSPEALSVKRLLKPGARLTELLVHYSELLNSLANEQEQNHKLNKYIDGIIEEIEDSSIVMKLKRDEMIKCVKQNEYLKHCTKLLMHEVHKQRQKLYSANGNCSTNGSFGATPDSTAVTQELNQEVGTLHQNKNDDEINNLLNGLQNEYNINYKTEIESEQQKWNYFSFEEEEEDMLGSRMPVRKSCLSFIKKVCSEQDIMYGQNTQYYGNYQKLQRQVQMLSKLVLKTQKGNIMDSSMQTDPLPPDEKIVMLQDEVLTLERTVSNLERQVGHEEILRRQLDELRSEGAQLAAQLDIAHQNVKSLQTNCETRKTKLLELDKKNRNYNTTIAKHETTIQQLQNTIDELHGRLDQTSVQLINLQHENQQLQNAEMQFSMQQHMMTHTNHKTEQLFAHINMIRSTLENSEAKGRMHLQSELDKSMAETSSLRQKYNEIQEQYNEIERQMKKTQETAQDHINNLEKELDATKLKLEVKEEEIKALSSIRKPFDLPKEENAETSVLAQLVKSLETDLATCQLKLEVSEKLLAESKNHCKIYSESCLKLEKDFKDSCKQYQDFKVESDERLKTAKDTIQDLEVKVSVLSQELSDALQCKVQLEQCKSDLEQIKTLLEEARTDLTNQRVLLGQSEAKYLHKLAEHEADARAITSLKEELKTKGAELEKMKVDMLHVNTELEQSNASRKKSEDIYKNELQKFEERLQIYESKTHTSERINKLTEMLLAHPEDSFIPRKRKRSDSEVTGSPKSESTGPCNEVKNAPSTAEPMDDNEATIIDDNSSSNIGGDEKCSERLFNLVKSLRAEKTAAIDQVKHLTAELKVHESKDESFSIAEKTDEFVKQEQLEESLLESAKTSNLLKNENLDSLGHLNMRLHEECKSYKQQLKLLRDRCAVLESQLAEKYSDSGSPSKETESVHKDHLDSLKKRVEEMAVLSAVRDKQNRLEKKLLNRKIYHLTLAKKKLNCRLIGARKHQYKTLISHILSSEIIKQRQDGSQEICSSSLVQAVQQEEPLKHSPKPVNAPEEAVVKQAPVHSDINSEKEDEVCLLLSDEDDCEQQQQDEICSRGPVSDMEESEIAESDREDMRRRLVFEEGDEEEEDEEEAEEEEEDMAELDNLEDDIDEEEPGEVEDEEMRDHNVVTVIDESEDAEEPEPASQIQRLLQRGDISIVSNNSNYQESSSDEETARLFPSRIRGRGRGTAFRARSWSKHRQPQLDPS